MRRPGKCESPRRSNRRAWPETLWLLTLLTVLPACGGGSSEPPLEIPRDRLSSEQAVERGRALYDRYCALCHGEDGHGHGPRRSSLSTQPRDFASPAFDLGPGEIFHTLESGVPGTAMPSFMALSEDERWDVTAYVLELAGGAAGSR